MRRHLLITGSGPAGPLPRTDFGRAPGRPWNAAGAFEEAEVGMRENLQVAGGRPLAAGHGSLAFGVPGSAPGTIFALSDTGR
ncbi:hypothetical protein [Saccharopolyspora shandongensis]|uniref:hypothetical protein n=1 Tax=Saccharopolyspora shandongensis TaxID=418495 RepID=UPI0033D3EFC3